MRIAIIGANGQVGREVCLYLSVLGVTVVPISRSELGAAFLERCGLPCICASVSDENDARWALAGCDLVADFSFPSSALPAETRPILEAGINTGLRWTPERAPYVYISTISAFGMLHAASEMRNYFFSYSRYAANKRYAERLALAGRHRRPVYALRLGQVHGELQTVSREFTEEVMRGKVEIPFSPDTHSYTVFCFTIAEALRNIALGREQPGLYTLVSTPAWTWGESYSYWARRAGIETEFVVDERRPERETALRRAGKISRYMAAPILRWASEYRDLVINYGFARSPAMQLRLQALYLRRRAAEQIAEMNGHRKPGRKFWIGEVPGRRLTSLSDSRVTMADSAKAVQDIIAAVVESTGRNRQAVSN